MVRQSQDSLLGDPELMRIMEGLIQVPTVFAMSGESNAEYLIVAQSVRQNVKAAMQLPMRTMELAGMVLNSCKLKVGVSSVQTAMLMEALHRCTKKCDANLVLNAYDMEPVAKRARTGRKKSAVVTALAIASVGSADGESNWMNEPV